METAVKDPEIAIIHAESILDGLTQHTRRHRCIPNPVQKHLFTVLGQVRIARDNLRRKNGYRQWTMVSVPGGGNSADYNKKWRFKPEGRFDCGVERGLKADCWHCEQSFVKREECPTCQFFICSNCRKCACQLTPEARRVVEITIKTIFGPNWRKLSRTMGEAK